MLPDLVSLSRPNLSLAKHLSQSQATEWKVLHSTSVDFFYVRLDIGAADIVSISVTSSIKLSASRASRFLSASYSYFYKS